MFCFFSLSLEAKAQPNIEIFEYVVQEGDTCAAIAERLYGNRRRYDIIHAFNPGMGPPPHQLKPGQVLRLPRRPVEASAIPDARVTGTVRQVEAMQKPTSEWIQAREGLELYRGGRVHTAQKSAAEITFRDTSVLIMREESMVIIFGPSTQGTRQAGMQAQLESGALRTRLGELRGEGGNRIDVATPSSLASFQGGDAIVSVDTKGTTRISNHSSKARVQGALGRRRGPAVDLPPNTGSVVAQGQPPSPPRPLPNPPQWVDGPRKSLGISGYGGVIRGEWSHVDEVIAYHIEISRKPDGREVVFESTVPATITHFEAHGLQKGEYFVSLSTIDKDGLESRPSTLERFEILEAKLIAPYDTETQTQSLGGMDVPQAIPVLAGTILDLPAGVSCSQSGNQPTQAMGQVLVQPGLSLSCTFEDQTITLPQFSVRAIQTRAPGLDFGKPIVLKGGTRQTLQVEASIDGDLPPDLTIALPSPLKLLSASRQKNLFNIEIEAPSDATGEFTALWVIPSAPLQPLGSFTIALESVSSEPPPDSPMAPPPIPIHKAASPQPFGDGWSQVLNPSSLSLEEFEQEGLRASLAIGATIRPSRNEIVFYHFPEPRLVAGVHYTAPFGLGVGIRLPIDLAHEEGSRPLTWTRGHLDPFVSIRWTFLRRNPETPSLGLAVEMGAWIPTRATSDQSLSDVRLAPSLHFAYLLAPTFTLRSRQGMLLESNPSQALIWTSAFGMDWEPLALLNCGIEMNTLVGKEREGQLYAMALAPHFGVSISPIFVDFSFRFGLNEQGRDVFGSFGAALSLSLYLR
ncbi:MAG: LysM peptidoglycan-binding domain-containing protein [Sandaracinaceae bacterium]|nr:LysM peptidoglycan-binding domain-containing protein [Sandaracinaceae bacterium]